MGGIAELWSRQLDHRGGTPGPRKKSAQVGFRCACFWHLPRASCRKFPPIAGTLGELRLCQEASMTTIFSCRHRGDTASRLMIPNIAKTRAEAWGLLSCRKLLRSLQRASNRGKPRGGLLGWAFACCSPGRHSEPQEAPAAHTELLWLRSCPPFPWFQCSKAYLLDAKAQPVGSVSSQVRECGWDWLGSMECRRCKGVQV